MPQRKPRIAVLGLMTDVYRSWPDIQDRMEKWAETIFKNMRKFAKVTFSGVCDTRPLVDEAMEKIEKERPDLLIPFSMTYSPSLYTLSALKRTRLPILVLNTQILNRWDSDAAADCFTDNEAPTGVFDLTNALVRSGIPFEIVSGYSEDPDLYREIAEWAEAAAAVRDASGMRIGMIGYPMRGSGDFAVDHAAFMAQLGIEVLHINLTEAADLLKNAPAKEVTAFMEEDKKRFVVHPSLDKDSHRESAGLEWAFRRLVETYGLAGITFHFEAMANDGRFKTLPMVGISKLLAEGTGFGGEGDVTSTALTAILNRLCPEVDFFESWGMDFEGGGILKNHMGEGNLSLARPDLPIRLTRTPFSFGNVTYTVVPGFTLKEGEATLANLSVDCSGRIKIVAAEGRVPDFKPIGGIDTPHGKFMPDMDFKAYLRAYAHAGGTHHGALAYGRRAGLIEKYCRMANIGFLRLC